MEVSAKLIFQKFSRNKKFWNDLVFQREKNQTAHISYASSWICLVLVQINSYIFALSNSIKPRFWRKMELSGLIVRTPSIIYYMVGNFFGSAAGAKILQWTFLKNLPLIISTNILILGWWGRVVTCKVEIW